MEVAEWNASLWKMVTVQYNEHHPTINSQLWKQEERVTACLKTVMNFEKCCNTAKAFIGLLVQSTGATSWLVSHLVSRPPPWHHYSSSSYIYESQSRQVHKPYATKEERRISQRRSESVCLLFFAELRSKKILFLSLQYSRQPHKKISLLHFILPFFYSSSDDLHSQTHTLYVEVYKARYKVQVLAVTITKTTSFVSGESRRTIIRGAVISNLLQATHRTPRVWLNSDFPGVLIEPNDRSFPK